MTYYYAQIDDNNICFATSALSGEVIADDMILIAIAEQAPAGFDDLAGKQYNRETGEWSDPVYLCYVKVDSDGFVVDTKRVLTPLSDSTYTQVDSLDGIWQGCVFYGGQYMEMQKACYLMLKAMAN